MNGSQRIGILSHDARSNRVFCNGEMETLNHVIWKIWTNLLSWWSLQWQPLKMLLLDWWRCFIWRKFDNKVWDAIPMATFWSIWRMRNDCVFNGKQPMMEELCELIKIRVALWFKAHSSECLYSIQDLVDNSQRLRNITQ